MPTFPLAPPPPDAARTGPAREALSAVAEHVTAERRAVLDVATRGLTLTPAGRLVAGGHAYPLEEGGLRALLMHYTAAFPRLTPSALLMRPAVLASVFGCGLADHARELPPEVRLRVRTGPEGPAIYGATPCQAPPYDVDAVLRDLGDAAPLDAHAPGSLVVYAAGASTATAHLRVVRDAPTGAWLRVTVEDGYPCRVSVSCGVGSRDLGDPAPEVERRRRVRADLSRPADGFYTELFRGKLAAVPAWVRAKGDATRGGAA